VSFNTEVRWAAMSRDRAELQMVEEKLSRPRRSRKMKKLGARSTTVVTA
jgi:hypothetical protein